MTATQHSVHPTDGSLRVFGQFLWLEVGSVKTASSRPAHPRVTLPVGQPNGVLAYSMSSQWSITMSRKFQIIKTISLVLSILIFLAIPVVSLIMTAFSWHGSCIFGAPCPWWEYTTLLMFVISTDFIPFLVVTSLVWLSMAVIQFLSMRKKS
jgi:hypothetical protein